MTRRIVRGPIAGLVLLGLVVVPSIPLLAGTSEFGVAVPVATSFSFSSYSMAVEAYARWIGAALAWETALRTSTGFSSLYIRNTIATTAALYLCVGHVTSILPYFGSTYFTAGLGLALGQSLVARVSVLLAVSISVYGVYWFPELRVQIGLDP